MFCVEQLAGLSTSHTTRLCG